MREQVDLAVRARAALLAPVLVQRVERVEDVELDRQVLAAEAREEILVIAIGDPVPEEIVLSNRDALQRGLEMKFLFHRFDDDR